MFWRYEQNELSVEKRRFLLLPARTLTGSCSQEHHSRIGRVCKYIDSTVADIMMKNHFLFQKLLMQLNNIYCETI